MLSIQNLNLRSGDKTILKNFNLELQNGIYALTGPNGSGKSSLARTIMGIGKLEIDGSIIWQTDELTKFQSENLENNQTNFGQGLKKLNFLEESKTNSAVETQNPEEKIANSQKLTNMTKTQISEQLDFLENSENSSENSSTDYIFDSKLVPIPDLANEFLTSNSTKNLIEISQKTSPDLNIENEKIDLTKLETWQRARLGIFLSFQNPPIVKGVSCLNLLKVAMENQNLPKLTSAEILKIIKKNSEILKISNLYRQKLENLSGGERKKLEILQMLCLEPKLAILDEVDSGLDVDSVKLVAQILQDYITKNPQKTLLIISHNPEFLNLFSGIKVLDI